MQALHYQHIIARIKTLEMILQKEINHTVMSSKKYQYDTLYSEEVQADTKLLSLNKGSLAIKRSHDREMANGTRY